MRKVRGMLAVVVVVAATVGLGATAGATKADDQEAAEAAVLSQADVPSGFTGGPVGGGETTDQPPECTAAMVKADKSVEKAPIARSAFELSGGGYAFIQNAVAVMPSAAQAKKAMKAYSDEAAAEACFQARFEELFAEPGITTSISMGSFAPEEDDKGNAKVIEGGDDFLGFSGSVRRSQGGGAPQFFEVQAVLAREGRAVTQLVIVAGGTIPRDDAQQMLQTVITGMGKA